MQLVLISMSLEMQKILKCLTLAGNVSCCPTAMTLVKRFSLELVLEMVVPKRKLGRKDLFYFLLLSIFVAIQTSSSQLCAEEESPVYSTAVGFSVCILRLGLGTPTGTSS